MTIPLRVPRRYEGGIAKIRDLSDESAQAFLAALRDIPHTYNEDSLSAAVAKTVDTIAVSDIEEMVPALLSVYSYLDHSRLTIPEVAEGIAQAMEESESEEFRLPSEDRASFEDRLAQLLSVDSLKVTVKAGVLALQNEHTLREARILTDIRPVFEPENLDTNPVGAVIIHTLKVSY